MARLTGITFRVAFCTLPIDANLDANVAYNTNLGCGSPLFELSFRSIFILSLHHYIRRSSFFRMRLANVSSLLFRKGHQG
jgi:hypothetical protein